jgi:hypothetical protein
MPSTPRPPRPVARGRTAITTEERRARGRAGALKRHHPGSAAAFAEMQAIRDAAAERYVRKLVESWPPLSAGQRNRLATLLAVPDHDGDSQGEGAADG